MCDYGLLTTCNRQILLNVRALGSTFSSCYKIVRKIFRFRAFAFALALSRSRFRFRFRALAFAFALALSLSLSLSRSRFRFRFSRQPCRHALAMRRCRYVGCLVSCYVGCTRFLFTTCGAALSGAELESESHQTIVDRPALLTRKDDSVDSHSAFSLCRRHGSEPCHARGPGAGAGYIVCGRILFFRESFFSRCRGDRKRPTSCESRPNSEIPIAPQHMGRLLIHMWVARTYGGTPELSRNITCTNNAQQIHIYGSTNRDRPSRLTKDSLRARACTEAAFM